MFTLSGIKLNNLTIKWNNKQKRLPIYSRLRLPPICAMVFHLFGTLSQVDTLKYIKMNHMLSFPSREMSCFSVDPGDKTNQHTTSSAPQGQLQRQTLLVTGGHKRCPSVPAFRERALTIPVQSYTMPFYPDFRPQPQIKGISFFLLLRGRFSSTFWPHWWHLYHFAVSQKDLIFQTLYRGGK